MSNNYAIAILFDISINGMAEKSRRLNIAIGKHSGFCFGVKRAYKLACVNSKNCTDIYILGKLVHNNDVCRDLKKRGIKEIKSVNQIKEGTVIFTAHGDGPNLYKTATNRGLKIIDTTCPKVMRAQRLAKAYTKKGYQVIIFGDKGHKEVRSILEWSGDKAKVVNSLADLKKMKIDRKKKHCLISQTTQNVEEFKKLVRYLDGATDNFIFFDTICQSTDDRQKEVRKLAKANDAVIVVGGHDSANSRRLFEIAKSINPKSYFIENTGQLKKNWFSDVCKVAVTAGASTPEWIIGEVVEKIKQFK